MTTPKIKFSYLYRDAGNNKMFGEVIFSNPENMAIQEIEENLRAKLIDGEYFDPKLWDLPRLTFDSFDPELDHEWMEFENIELTSDDVTDDRTIEKFLVSVKEKE